MEQTPITVGVPKNALKAALHCVAKNDSRSYLNGVLIELRGEHANIVSSDGHTLFACKVEVEEGGHTGQAAAIIVPAETVKAALKGLGKWTSNVALSSLPGGFYRLGDTAFTPIDGRFPDYMRVIPKTVSGKVGAFDPALVLCVSKAVAVFYGRGRPSLMMNGPTAPAVIVGATADCVGVVMPRRVDGGAKYRGFVPATHA
ncbi:MAG: DNA polymerase III subunit beta [bacterium]